jgi:hypothetical protein
VLLIVGLIISRQVSRRPGINVGQPQECWCKSSLDGVTSGAVAVHLRLETLFGTRTSYLASTGLHRLFSLRHDLLDADTKLAPAPRRVKPPIPASQQYGSHSFCESASCRWAPLAWCARSNRPVVIGGLALTLTGSTSGNWRTPPGTNIGSADIAVSGPVISTPMVEVTASHFDTPK